MKSASLSGSLSLNGAEKAKIRANTGGSSSIVAEVDSATPSDSFSGVAIVANGDITMDGRGTGAACAGSGALDNTDASGDLRARLTGNGADTVLATAGPGQTGVGFSYSLSDGQKVEIEAV